MDVDDAAYRLLQSVKRAKSDDGGSTDPDKELRAYISDSKEMRACWSALNGLHQRTSEARIDCDYVATLETANTYVAYLAGIGVVTDKFAADFAEAASLNKDAAMTMTAEARQTKLSLGITEELYLIELEDWPSKRAPRTSYGDFFVSAKGSSVNADDGELTPRTEFKSTGARLPVYDDFVGAYEGLTEMGNWVTANDALDDLFSLDRFRSFARFINGTHTNRAIVAAGTGIMLMGADFLPPYLRAALFGGSAYIMTRAARRAVNQAAENELAQWAAGLGAGGFTAFLAAMQQVLTPPPEEPQWWWQRIWHGFAAWWDGNPVGAGIFSDWANHIPGIERIRNSQFLMQAATTIYTSRHTLAVSTLLGFVTYYAAAHHSWHYVPSRQRYYLHINRLEIFEKYTDDLKACLNRIKAKIKRYQPMPDVPAPNGGMRRPSHDAQRVWDTDKRNHEMDAEQYGDDLDAILRRRRDVNDDADTHDELEQACRDVNRFMNDLRAKERQIQRLAARVRAKLASFVPPIHVPPICPTNASVVDEVFAQLRL